MNDEELGRALRSAVNETPSRDFQARVRMRIAEEPPRLRWEWPLGRRTGAAVFVVGVVVLVTAVWPRRTDDRPAGPRATRSASLADIALPSIPVLPPIAEPVAQASRGVAPRPSIVRRSEPAVLISPAEAEGVRLLAAAAFDGRIAAAMLESPPAEPAETALRPPDAIVVEPVTIAPLMPLTH